MTHPHRNRDVTGKRSRLMAGCGSAAMALALMLAPEQASAQGIQASPDVTFGSAEVFDVDATTTQVEIFSPTVVIDWTPQVDNNGDALDFLRTGATAIFQAGQFPDFAVLNRILPTANGNIAVIDGAVISQIFGPAGLPETGGFVAFYSPTGILVGSNATFDVGRLLLTTLDTSPDNFDNFANGGFLTLAGQQGSTARISISPGAQISALAENSFFAVVAADVEMRGIARVNGSHAYVAGEVVNLRFSNGLFDISVPVGTAAAGEVVTVDGTVGGPASTGAGDNHMIYGVAVAQNDPISMLFRGNLGFDPAQGADVVNGEIILSANHNVFGRSVDGSSIADGINATFGANSALSAVRADIFIQDFTATSSLLAIGSHRVQAIAVNSASTVRGNLLLVGRENAEVFANSGQNFSVTGDLLVDARDFGVVSSSLQTLDAINAQGGAALVDASQGAVIRVGGNALVTADAFGGAEDLNRIAGTARGGSALIGARGGQVIIDGAATVSARGLGTTLPDIQTGAEARGGIAEVFATLGGSASIGQNLIISADAIGANGSLFGPSTASDAFGGQALITVFGGGGTVNVGGFAQASANARGGTANTAGAGSLADAGEAVASITGPGNITITGQLRLDAEASGGTNAGGTGGLALGGRASATTFSGGRIAIGGRFDADTLAQGGNGQTGGDAFGGIAGANAVIGEITIAGRAFAGSEAVGGSATFGNGGNGGLGRGGNSFFQADGTLTETALLTIGGDAIAFAQGVGGNGGAGDSQIAGGRGGDGFGGQFAVPNQADPAFGSGAFILAGGDNGTITVSGEAVAVASAVGGRGGIGGSGTGSGDGGNATGGLAQVGLALLGQNGSVGLGSAQFGDVLAQSDAFAGDAGDAPDPDLTGNGGNATGGVSVLTVRAGDVTAASAEIIAFAFGGRGRSGGAAVGGTAAAFGGQGGTLTLDTIELRADGFGGSGIGISGGTGRGGAVDFDFQGLDVTVNGDVRAEASGFGGGAENGNGGDGFGGIVRLGVLGPVSGTGTIAGNAAVVANGFGGPADIATSGFGGDGAGGEASVEVQAGGLVQVGSLQVTASARGGVAETQAFVGGDASGGNARIFSAGTGSRLIVERNTPTDFADDMNLGAILAANGFGGVTTGGAGIGGNGSGGGITLLAQGGGSIALPVDPLADPNGVGEIRLLARGFGGDSTVAGGAGGFSRGGTGTIEVDGDGSSIIMGAAIFSVFAQGGSGVVSANNTAGGNAIGGVRRIRVLNGGAATLELIGGVSGAQGGNATGGGDGGDATAGSNVVELIDGTLNIVGVLTINDQSAGGNGAAGGDVFGGGEGSGLAFLATDSTVNFIPSAQGEAGIAIGGTFAGGAGTASGGNATAARVSFRLDNTDLSGGFLRIDPLALGGVAAASAGQGGNATAGAVNIAITGSTVALAGETLITANAEGGDGGDGSGGRGGNATSGVIDMLLDDASLTVAAGQTGARNLRLVAQARAGAGATTGNATSGRTFLSLAGSSLDADEILLDARAFAAVRSAGQTGGSARGGQGLVTLSGASTIDAALVEIDASAITSTGGASFGGTASFQVASGSAAVADIASLGLFADALGADAAARDNAAGQFFVNIGGGNVNLGTLTARATGDTIDGDPSASELVASGGNLNVANELSASAFGDILVRTGQGGIIGGPRAAATTTSVDIISDGVIIVEGDNNAAVGLGGNVVRLSARDIDIAQGARIGADRVILTSLERGATAILGGTSEGDGFSLTGDELGRISARELDTNLPQINVTTTPVPPSVLVRDLSLTGSGNNGFAAVRLRVGSDIPSGVMRIEGNIALISAATADVLQIEAGRIELVTPGSIRVEGTDNAPGGNLRLTARDIWAADAATITQLQQDRSFAGRDAQLAVAASGSDDPLGYIRAGGVSITAADSLLVRNTGVALAGGGILVGGGGLSIAASGQQSPGGGLDVFAYGRRQTAPGVFVVGEAFFDEVNFNRVAPGTSTYLAASAFNDCIINTGECPQPPPPPEPPVVAPPEINNPTLFEPPLVIGGDPPAVAGEDDDRFGIDFPERPEAPLISEDPLLDDPVTSGGDASLYGSSAVPPAGGK